MLFLYNYNVTLTQTAILTKQFITISIVAIVLGTASFIGYKIWYAYYLAHLPVVEERPDNKFGLLPKPNFPDTEVSSSNFTYSLDTTTGGLPKLGVDPGFEKIIKVYFVNQSFATLLAPDRSQALADKFKFTTSPQILSETKYKFEDQDKNLLVDLDTGNFSYTNSASVSAKQSLDDDNKLVAGFKQILSSLGVLKNELKDGNKKIILLRDNSNELIPTTIRSEAEAAQISLWPQAIDKKTIFTPDFNKSIINAIVFGSADNLDNYRALNFTYFPIDTTTFATYRLKNTEDAFNDLKNGKGIIVVAPTSPQVSITAVSLGYYLAEKYSPYLQPIFVFEGPNFAAYTAAIGE